MAVGAMAQPPFYVVLVLETLIFKVEIGVTGKRLNVDLQEEGLGDVVVWLSG